jgi:protein required for attachment to host cells
VWENFKRVTKTIVHLKPLQLDSRNYQKRDAGSGNRTEEIFKKRKVENSSDTESENEEVIGEESIERMSVLELKAKLKSLGVNSRKRTLESLRAELKTLLKSK